jgi:peptide/nickel transport system substrate-binding protein
MKRFANVFLIAMVLFIACTMSVAASGQEDEAAEVDAVKTESQVEFNGVIVIYNTPDVFTEQTGMTISQFSEAPELKKMVENNELDPVEKRISEAPLVVQPSDSIGSYGGIFRGAATTPTNEGWDLATIREQKLFSYLPDLSTVYPNIAKSVEFINNNKTMIIYLREGMRWSDGENYTADDFMFWYEDIFTNEEITPVPSPFWIVGGKPVVMKKIDDYTVQFDFSLPNPTIAAKISKNYTQIDPYAPAHYLKQFHIKYNADANELAKKEGFENWSELFLNNYTREDGGQKQVNLDLPVLNPWVWVSVDTAGNRFFERNAYYWKVDTAGNQLPYMDEMHRLVVQNTDSKTIGTMNGEYSISSKDLSLTDFPMFKENEEKGNYRAFLGTGVKGSYIVFGFNTTYPKDPILTESMSDVRFRQAMSVALNRAELNEVIFLGQGIPRQIGPIPQTSYAEPWMNNYYAEYDPAKANQLLDEMGLVWDAKKEYRLRSDGTTFTVPHEYWRWSDNVAQAVELTTEYWKAIGIKMEVKELEPSIYFERRAGNDLAIVTWGGDNQTEIALYVNSEWSQPPWQVKINTPWQLWWESGKTDGIEPPADMIELFDWNEQRLQEVIGSDKYMELSKKIATRNLEGLYQIGTVGLVPNSVIFDNDLGNTPISGVFTGDANFFMTYFGETFFYKN